MPVSLATQRVQHLQLSLQVMLRSEPDMPNWFSTPVLALKNSLIGGRYAPLQIRWAHGDRAYIRAQDIYLRRGVELLVSIGARGKIRRVEVLEVRPRSRPDAPVAHRPANDARASYPPASAPQPLHHQPHPAASAAHVPRRARALESAWFAASERVDLGEMETRSAGLMTWQHNLEQIDQSLTHASFERLSLGTDSVERSRPAADLQSNQTALRSLRRQIRSYDFTWRILGGVAVLTAIVVSYFLLF